MQWGAVTSQEVASDSPIAPGETSYDSWTIESEANVADRSLLFDPAADRPTLAEAVQRAHHALRHLTQAPDALLDPLVVSALTIRRRDEPSFDVRPWLDALMQREASYGRDNGLRYQWDLSHHSLPGSSAYLRPWSAPRLLFRPLEQAEFDENPTRYGRRLMEPLVVTAQFGLWGAVARDEGSPFANTARHLLDEATPIAENDLAHCVEGLDPWHDTLALSLLSAQPEAMERLRNLIFTLALRYGAIAQRQGPVRGTRHPYFDRPLVSASAQLAGGLWRFGIYPSVIPDLVRFVIDAREHDGGWGDTGQPSDLLTTLVTADLLTRIDPDFDPAPTVDFFLASQEQSGWWRALNPEVPWLTAAIADWLERTLLPFSARFTWPSPLIWQVDRLTGLPTLAILLEMELLIQGLPSLARQPMEVAFIDLANFGGWNKAHGQVAGDRVIAQLGKTLRELPSVFAVRIGGDEIMVFGQPGAAPGALVATLDLWRRGWPQRLMEVPAVAVPPRVVVGHGLAGQLETMRKVLGQRIADVKNRWPSPPPEGVLIREGDL